MKIEIKNRLTGSVIFKCNKDSIKLAVEFAVEKKIDLSDAYLSGADLRGADLSGAYLSGADLRGAYLRGAYLSDADLSGADLRGAYLRGAYLSGADLRGAYLSGAYLSDADLSGADLRGAYLSDAYLSDADLSGADLSEIKEDYLKVLSVAKNEVVEFYKKLIEGKINGSVYEGECACLCGTIANIRKESFQEMGIDLRPDASRPIEKWFLNIRKGDTPENSQVSALVRDWTHEFANKNGIELPKMKVVWE